MAIETLQSNIKQLEVMSRVVIDNLIDLTAYEDDLVYSPNSGSNNNRLNEQNEDDEDYREIGRLLNLDDDDEDEENAFKPMKQPLSPKQVGSPSLSPSSEAARRTNYSKSNHQLHSTETFHGNAYGSPRGEISPRQSSSFPASLSLKLRRELQNVKELVSKGHAVETQLTAREEAALRQQASSPEPIAASPSLENDYLEKHKILESSDESDGGVFSENVSSEAAVRHIRTPEPIPTTPSLEEHFMRRAGVKTPEPIATTPSLELYQHRAAAQSTIEGQESLDPSLRQARMVNTDSFDSQNLYRRAIAARQRKATRSTGSAGGSSFKPIAVKDNDEQQEIASYRKNLKEKYKKLVISPASSQGGDLQAQSDVKSDASINQVDTEDTREEEDQRDTNEERREERVTPSRMYTSKARELLRPENFARTSPRHKKGHYSMKDKVIEIPAVPSVQSEPSIREHEHPEIPAVSSEPKKRRGSPMKDHPFANRIIEVPSPKAAVDKTPFSKVSTRGDDQGQKDEDVKDKNIEESAEDVEPVFLKLPGQPKSPKLDTKDFTSVVAKGSVAQTEAKMEESVMKLVNSADGEEVENNAEEGNVATAGSESSTSSESENETVERQVMTPVPVAEEATTSTDQREKKHVAFASDVDSPKGKGRAMRKFVEGAHESADEATSEDESRGSVHSGHKSGSESDSRMSMSIVDTDSSETLDAEPDVGAHMLYDSDALGFVVALLDKSCAWLEDENCNSGCADKDSSLLKEIKKKAKANPVNRSARVYKSGRERVAMNKVSERAQKSALVTKLDETSRASSKYSSSETEEEVKPQLSPFARPRRRRSVSPKKKRQEQASTSEESEVEQKRPPSPRRRRSKSPRKKRASGSDTSSASSANEKSQDLPTSPYQKKLQETLESERNVSSELRPDPSQDNGTPRAGSMQLRSLSPSSVKSERSASPIKQTFSETKSVTSQYSTRSGGAMSPSKAHRPPSPTKEGMEIRTAGSHTSMHSVSFRRDPTEIRTIGSSRSTGMSSPRHNSPLRSALRSSSPSRDPVALSPLASRTQRMEPPEMRTLSPRSVYSDDRSVGSRHSSTLSPRSHATSSPRSPQHHGMISPRSQGTTSPRSYGLPASPRSQGTTSPRSQAGMSPSSQYSPIKSSQSHHSVSYSPRSPDSRDDNSYNSGSYGQRSFDSYGRDSYAMNSVDLGVPDLNRKFSSDRSVGSELRRVIRNYGGPEQNGARRSRRGPPPADFARVGAPLDTIIERSSPFSSRATSPRSPNGGGKDDSLTEIERQAALDLAEKLRRRAATLKRRRQARERRLKEMVERGYSVEQIQELHRRIDEKEFNELDEAIAKQERLRSY